jgi:hypothetical protein
MFSADPNHQSCSNVRRGRELQCSSSQIDSVVPSSMTQFLAFLDVRSRDFVGVLSVVIPRTARYESGIKRRTDRAEIVAWNNKERDLRLSDLPHELQEYMENYIQQYVPRNRVVYHWFDVYDLEEQRI